MCPSLERPDYALVDTIDGTAGDLHSHFAKRRGQQKDDCAILLIPNPLEIRVLLLVPDHITWRNSSCCYFLNSLSYLSCPSFYCCRSSYYRCCLSNLPLQFSNLQFCPTCTRKMNCIILTLVLCSVAHSFVITSPGADEIMMFNNMHA